MGVVDRRDIVEVPGTVPGWQFRNVGLKLQPVHIGVFRPIVAGNGEEVLLP